MLSRFEEKYTPVTETGCWLWEATPSAAYGSFWLNGKTIGAHRASWIIHNGDIPEGLYVLHKCDVKGCVNPDHLYVGTHKENMRDAVDRNRMQSGENHRRSRGYKYLSFDEVGTGILSKKDCMIIYKLATKSNKKELAERYGVHIATIYRAIDRADALLEELEK